MCVCRPVPECVHAQGEAEGADHGGEGGPHPQVQRELLPGGAPLPHSLLCLQREDPHQGRLLQDHDHGEPMVQDLLWS